MTDQHPIELSPAQKVLAAFKERHELSVLVDDDWVEQCLAAALEAVADQVVPFAEITPQKDLESRRDAMVWGMQHQTQLTRQQLLAIAAELRGTGPTNQED